MSWHEWLLMPQNQFVLVFCLGINLCVYHFAYKKGERDGYEDGLQVMYKTVVVNMLDENELLRRRINHEC
jgi:hypothetical protein